MSALLEIENLSVAYGQVSALHGITLSVHAGEAVALVGANGAGKSTLFKSIVGFLRPRSGRLRFLGRDMTGVRPERRARSGLGMRPKAAAYFPAVRENLEVAVFGSKADRAHRLDVAFALFPHERQTQLGWQLSGGQQQMLAIGRALMGQPQLLLLDEPSLGLSPKLADEVLAAVRSIVRRGTAVLLAEQNVRKALACCDRAYVLETGKVALSGASAALRDTEEIRKAFLGA
jgi:branched-chain amino acid transport system ATP-binding protein